MTNNNLDEISDDKKEMEAFDAWAASDPLDASEALEAFIEWLSRRRPGFDHKPELYFYKRKEPTLIDRLSGMVGLRTKESSAFSAQCQCELIVIPKIIQHIIHHNAVKCLEDITLHLRNTHESLDRAEQDFNDGAFSPFWSSIEDAINNMLKLNEAIENIELTAQDHTDLAKYFLKLPDANSSSLPNFPIKINEIRANLITNSPNQRLNALVRKAHTNFNFATIFEQRKTNNLLIKGFENLSQGIEGIGSKMMSSITSLNDQLVEISQDINSQLANFSSHAQHLNSNIENLNASSNAHAKQLAMRHDRAIKELQKIEKKINGR